MDLSDIAAMNLDRVPNAWADSPHVGRWRNLEERAGDDAAHLLQLVCRLDPPDRIAELRGLETEQCDRGAGFLGMLPDQIPDSLETPRDIETALTVSIRLAEIRSANLAAIAETMPRFPLAFAGGAHGLVAAGPVPAGWRLDVDVDGIRTVLEYLDTADPNEAAATAIAGMPAFVEMIRHRRDLGYVPEPIIDEAGFAWCLVHAASRDPIDELWKWLHPQNLFDLSDLSAHRAEYRRLIDLLVQDDRLATAIFSSIAPYAPQGIAFEDRLSFAVGWGIRGWATAATGGMNIEHGKDDFAFLMPTLIHETFHRLQTVLAFANPEIAEPGFDRITSYPFDEARDRRLYGALCYVMLEGSATYVADLQPIPGWREDAQAGVELLERIRTLDSEEDEAFDELLSEGLRSNGPFYGFGALLAHALVKQGNPSSLGIALRRGAPFFVDHGLLLLGDAAPDVPGSLAADVARLRSTLETSS